MTPAELIAFGKARHGQQWIRSLSQETGYSFSHLWRIAYEDRPVSEKLERTLALLGKTKPRRIRELEQQGGNK